MTCCKSGCDMSGPEWAFRTLARAHHMAQGTVFDRLGLKDIGQPVMLFILRDMRQSGVKCTQKELCDIMHLSPSTVTISIKSLERRGYVKKRADDKDMRCNIVEITDLGADAAEKCRKGFDSIDSAMYAGFSGEERRLITQLFTRITQNLMALAEGEREHIEGRTTDDQETVQIH